jgi:hypothetical protein
MKAFGKDSVVLWTAAVFLLLALAIYVFRSFPHLLTAVVLGELVLLAYGALGPLVRDGLGARPLGRAALVLAAMALANGFMLLLAQRWGAQPHGWVRAVLHWQDGPLRLIASAIGFLDALLRAVLHLGRTPFSGGLPRPPAGLFPNLALGLLASVATALALRGLKAPARR